MTTDFTQKIISEHTVIARVITQSTVVESIMDAYIAEYYTRCPNGSQQANYLSFLYDVMNERSISIDTKKNILLKIFERIDEKKPASSVYKSFDKWLSIRNKFAHGRHIPDKGILYRGEFFDIQKLADQHAKLQIKIHAILQQHKELIGKYFDQIPLKDTEK